MPEIDPMTRSLSEYGAMLIITAIFLYFIVKGLNLVFKVLSDKINKHNHDSNIEIRTSVSKKVQSLISSFLPACDGDRIMVVEFTNSVMSVAYLPFKYMTCTYEAYRCGETPASSVIDHISTSLFTLFLETLQEEEIGVYDVDDATKPIDGAAEDVLHKLGQRRMVCALMTTTRGKAIGYVTLFKGVRTITQDDIDNIRILASKLSALLGILDK